MKRERYIAPALMVDQAEPQSAVALSLDTSKVDWKDNVDPEAKESQGGDNAWDDIW